MRQVAQFVSDKLAPCKVCIKYSTHFVLKKYKDHGTIISEPVQDERMLITPQKPLSQQNRKYPALRDP